MDAGQLDFSTREVPQSWVEASEHAPQSDSGPLKKKGSGQKGKLIHAAKLDGLGAALAMMAMSIVGGAIWYYIATGSSWDDQWLPVGFGILMGIGVRLGGGKPEPSQRASIAVTGYVVASLIVLFLIHRNLVSTWETSPSLSSIEQSVRRGYLLNATNALALVLGGAAAAVVNLMTKMRS